MHLLHFTLSAENLAAFATLTLLEVVLGIDNILFLSILVERLPAVQRDSARRAGLFLAMFMRVGLLLGLSWVLSLRNRLVTVAGHGFSGRDLILLFGGLFLMGKAAHEIFADVEDDDDDRAEKDTRRRERAHASYGLTLLQIVLFDVIFSLDSVITAVGIGSELPVMVAAVLASVGLMLFFAKPIGDYVLRHPSMKVLALAFLLLIGVLLVADGMGQHVSKGYVYFAMAFSFGVELLNMRSRKRAQARRLARRSGASEP